MNDLEQEYLADKRYIHETLEHNRKHTERLHDKFDDFKLEVSKNIAAIQTKLGIYVAIASVVVGFAIKFVDFGNSQ